MDFCLEWIETLNFTISLLTEKMILNIGMNWKTYSFKFGPGPTVRLLVCHKNLRIMAEISSISALKSLRWWWVVGVSMIIASA